MKRLLLILTFTFFTNLMYSQNKIDIEFVDEKNVLLNNTKIDKTTSFSVIKGILGEPTVHKKYPTGKTNYHYKELGLSVHIVNDKLLFIGANYNWDGDKTFPNTTYTGKLKIDGVEFDKDVNEKIVSNIKNVEFLKIMPGLLMSKPLTEKKKTFAILGFKNDKITQIGFEFH